MKKLMMIAAILVSTVYITSAQEKIDRGDRERKTPEERAQMITNGLEKKLNLTAEQKTKVYQLNLARAKEMNELQKSRIEDRKQQMEARRSLMENSDKKLVEILNADQKKMYQDLKSENKAKLKEHKHHRKSRNRIDKSENSSK